MLHACPITLITFADFSRPVPTHEEGVPTFPRMHLDNPFRVACALGERRLQHSARGEEFLADGEEVQSLRFLLHCILGYVRVCVVRVLVHKTATTESLKVKPDVYCRMFCEGSNVM